jgi:hypothetical protein
MSKAERRAEFLEWRERFGKESMTDDPRLPPLSEPHLLTTPYQVGNMMDNKAIAFIPMWPVDFIRLTTPSEEALDEFISPDPDHKGDKMTVEDYNEAASAGYVNLAPWLTVEMVTGKVKSHEGRHRMAALYRSNPETYGWVAIELTGPDGYRVYKIEPPWRPNEPRQPTRYLTVDSVPSVLHGQFRPVTVRLTGEQLADAVSLWADRNE